jgi:hypothetical protein
MWLGYVAKEERPGHRNKKTGRPVNFYLGDEDGSFL